MDEFPESVRKAIAEHHALYPREYQARTAREIPVVVSDLETRME